MVKRKKPTGKPKQGAKPTGLAANNPWTYFTLGLRVADHVRNRSFRKTLQVLLEITNGELTLLDTPEETARDLPPELEHMAPKLPAILRTGRKEEQAAAGQLVSYLDQPAPAAVEIGCLDGDTWQSERTDRSWISGG